MHLTQKERRGGRARCNQATLFPYDCGGLRAKTRFEPVLGAHGPKRVSGNGQKRPSATGRKAVAGPFMNQSEKFQWVKRSKFRWLRARLSRFSRGWPQKGPFGLFWAPGGLGPIRKRRFGRHGKTAAGIGSNPIRLLKCHVRREKGPTRGPRGPSVAGRGAHVSPRSNSVGAFRPFGPAGVLRRRLLHRNGNFVPLAP